MDGRVEELYLKIRVAHDKTGEPFELQLHMGYYPELIHPDQHNNFELLIHLEILK